ncbi:MAG: hypothetical protein UHD07_00295 [Ruminobacter sp.]|jgi:hypothetical protein|nr:hypothetical protein [Ruminobacter sp.]
MRKVRKAPAVFRQAKEKETSREEIRERIRQCREAGIDVSITNAKEHSCKRCIKCDGKCMI